MKNKKLKKIEELQQFHKMESLKRRLWHGPINLLGHPEANSWKWIVKEYQDDFIIWNNALYSSEILVKFWNNELNNFEYLGVKKIKFKDFIENGIENFKKMYGFEYPSDAKLLIATSFVKNVLVGYTELVLISEEGTEFLQIPPAVSIIDETIKILKEFKQGLPENVLLHKLNTSGVHFQDIKKPIYISPFNELINEYDYYFDRTISGIIKIPDWKEIILKEKHSKISDIDLNGIASSNYHLIISYIFKGDKFPLETAEEYVRLRPIIFIDFYNMTESYPDYHPLKKNKIMEIIEALLFNKYGRNMTPDLFEDWLDNNIFLSAMNPYRYTRGGNIRNKNKHIDLIMREFVPVLNLENNPGNLFEDSVRKALADYKTWLNSLKDSSQGIIN